MFGFKTSSLFVLLILLCLPDDLLAQDQPIPSWKPMSLELYERAHSSVTLLRNTNDLIPLKSIDTLNIAAINLGVGSLFFQETLSNYTDVDRKQWHILEPGRFIEDVSSGKVKNTLSSYNLLIFSIYSEALHYEVHRNALRKFFEETDSTHRKIVYVFGDNQFHYDFPNADALIYASSKSPISASIAAQVIFGGCTAKGVLSKSWGKFNQGDGIQTDYVTRLGYAPPSLVGFDEQMLRLSVDSIVQIGLDSEAYPGAQVLIAKKGQIVFHKTYGYHSYKKVLVVKKNDLYDLASLTKVSAPLPALMMLYDKNQFHLDDPMEALLPRFRHSNKATLTWRSILAHNARLKPWIPYWTNTLKKHPKRNGWRYRRHTFRPDSSSHYPIKITDNLWQDKFYQKRRLKDIRKSPLNKKTGYVYSGLSFYLYPQIIQEITGIQMPEFLSQKLYHPLGARSLMFNPLNNVDRQHIIPTEKDTFFRMEQIHGTVHDEGAIMMGGVSGNAGLFGNANDLCKLFQMYLNKGSYGGQQYINASTVEEFTRCQYCSEGNHRGLGFDKPLLEYNPEKASYSRLASQSTFGHSGYTGTLVWADPEKELIMIFLSNRVYPTRMNRKLYNLNIRSKLHDAIYNSLKK